jgi:MtN3 and saliva related transmembrane protein
LNASPASGKTSLILGVIQWQRGNETKYLSFAVEHLFLAALGSPLGLQLLGGECHTDRFLVGLGASPFHLAGCRNTKFPRTMGQSPEVTLLGYLAATLTTLSFFPQAIKTIRTGDTTAISLRMYLMLSVGIACWGLYGFIIHDGPVMVANAITLFPALVVLQRKISQMLHNRHARRIQQG